MYLAKIQQKNGGQRFFLRMSYQDESGDWHYRDLFDLGSDPEDYIVYLDERAFYVSSVIEEALEAQGIDYNYDELEEILWPFLDPDIQRTITNFGGLKGRVHKTALRLSREELAKLQRNIHPFDRRRLYYLRFVQINMEGIVDQPLAFFNQLLGKSRDEIEQLFEFMELELRPWEMRGYLYAIFDLPRRFAPRFSRFIPDVQDQEQMDRYFLEEICRLNEDSSFIDTGASSFYGNGIHPYLRKYLVQYFDHFFRDEPFKDEGGREGSGWSPPIRPSDREYLKALGLSEDEFQRMDDKELTSHFRKRAQELHPDKGGSHEAFIALYNAYKIMIRRKYW